MGPVDIVLLVLIAAAVIGAVILTVRRKKHGCSCGCAGCDGCRKVRNEK